MTLTPVQSLCDPLDVVIGSGASLSAGYSLQGRVLTGVFMPAAWTAAGLTFQASHDGVTYLDVQYMGAEVSAAAAANTYIALDGPTFYGARFIKVRSGTSGAAVNQAAARTLTLMCGVPSRAQ